jgi:two-component system, OmpR family, sensor histidine kinase KdpD
MDKGPRSPLAYLAAAGAAALSTLVCLALDRFMSVAGLSMVYLVASVACALTLGRMPALVAAILCVSALNYFFIPPRNTFQVESAEYWWLLAVLLSLSLALNALVASLRNRQDRAELGEARAAQMHALSEALADCENVEAMARRAAEWLHAQWCKPCAVYLRASDGHSLQRWATPEFEPGFHEASVRWSLEYGRPLGRGCDDWRDLPLWCAPFARHGAQGAVQVLLAGRDGPDADTLRHWLALAAQIGLRIERERAASAARAAQESAGAEAARNTLLASLSHDLRTPLAGIVGTASTLRAQAESLALSQRERLLENIENEARDLTLMADNILQMARLSQPQTQLRMEWESVEEILGAAAARMRRRWPAARLSLRVTPGLPPVKAEAALLAQAIANFVDNAVRHSDSEPHVIVTAGRSRDGVFIAVRDHGRGLPEGEDADAIFDRYAKVGKKGGAGLGLAICKLVIQAHGGRIAARRCDPGCEFRTDLPAGEPPGNDHG